MRLPTLFVLLLVFTACGILPHRHFKVQMVTDKVNSFNEHQFDPYVYSGVVNSVYDGDTFTADVDLGFGVKFSGQKFRLYDCWCPEVRHNSKAVNLYADSLSVKKGKKIKREVENLILGKKVYLQTVADKKGKYGRWLVTLHLPGGHNLNNFLVKQGHCTKSKQ